MQQLFHHQLTWNDMRMSAIKNICLI